MIILIDEITLGCPRASWENWGREVSGNWPKFIQRAQAKCEWDFANAQLYRLCARNPLHDDLDVIIGKVWLIGRSYAAAIERKRTNAAPGDGFYERVVGPTIKNSDIDDWIKSMTEPSSNAPGSIEAMLSVHNNVTKLFRNISGGDKRSLASKYLHFHRPKSFYIFDSRAVAGMRLLSDAVGMSRKVPYDNADAQYSRFAQCCVRLRDLIKQHFGALLSPREIDKLLLDVFSWGESPGPLPRRKPVAS